MSKASTMGGAVYDGIVTLIIFKSFFGGDFLIVGCIEEVVIQGMPIIETCLHDDGPHVFVGTGDCEFAFFFQSLEVLDKLGRRLNSCFRR
jgi:hypothetical protein